MGRDGWRCTSIWEVCKVTSRATSFVGGKWLPATGDMVPVINPSDGSLVCESYWATADDVAVACGAATRAFPGWAATPSAHRCAYLGRIADALAESQDRLIAAQMAVSGKPLEEARIDLTDAIATYRYYAELGAGLDSRQWAPVDIGADHVGRTRFEPLGAVALIVPWNFPLVTSAWKIAPALAAGCTVVIKVSEHTPVNELELGTICQAIGLPPGVVNILVGGPECGEALTSHPSIRKISFTGSNAVGAKVAANAASRFIPLTQELGGKSPVVVLEDSDIAQAAQLVAAGIFYNAGQVCSATSRLLVQESIAGDLLDALAAEIDAIQVGDPRDTTVTMGPITTSQQLSRVEHFLGAARHEGLNCVRGGERKGQVGNFIAPTFYADVPVDSLLWREEVFGPVLCSRTFSTDVEAVSLANGSKYGLAATVIGKDAERLDVVAAQISAGHVWINSLPAVFPGGAWGGFKASGYGRELGPWGLNAFLGVKHITAGR